MRKAKSRICDKSELDSGLSPVFFEPMEPKILYSADALSGLISVDPFSDSEADDTSLNLTQSARFLEESFAAEFREQDDLFDVFPAEPLALDELQAVFAGKDTENKNSAEFETRETFSAAVSDPIESRHEIIFIDAATPDYGLLLEGKINDPNTDYQIVILQSDRDGIEQISSTLSALQGIDAIHLVSHGNEHGLQLGDVWISNDNLDTYNEQLQHWASALDDNADLLIYGCELAAGADGQLLINQLAELTTADVAASDDLTGAAALGGDWEFEHQVGQIDTSLAFNSELQSKYSNVLADFTVNVTTDSVDINPGDGIAVDAAGNTSLRAAIMEANALAGDDTITLPSGNYALTQGGLGEDLASSGDLDILDRLTITGADASTTIIDANDIDRVFHVLANASLELSNVTITGGAADTGAGVENAGSLLLVDSAVTQNTATGAGGGLHTVSGSTTLVERVEISANQAVQGAGVYADSSNPVITNATISTNNASNDGGGIYVLGGDVNVTNTTIVDNEGTTGGSGIKTFSGGTVSLQNTLLENTGDNLSGTVVSLGYNIDTDATSELTNPNDQTNVTVSLGALLNNGGPTRTHALLPGGTASTIDPAGLTSAPAVDQRGLLRDGTADIGAFEFTSNSAPTILSSGPYIVDEGAVATTVVGNVDADDGDGGAADIGITYSIVSNANSDADGDNAFTINPSSGEITVNDSGDLDFEATAPLVIAVQADDGMLTSVVSVTINLNDVAPTLTAVGPAETHAGEIYILDLIADEPGTSGITSYTVNWGDGNITTEPYTGTTTSVSHTYDNVGFTYSIAFAANDVSDTWTASNLLVTNWIAGTDDVNIIDGNDGNTVGTFESSGGDLRRPYGIVVGPDGNFYVAGFDSGNIVRYAADGSYLGIFSAHAQLNKPTGLAWGSDGNLYVGNFGGDNILRFNASGDFIDIWGAGGLLDAPEAIVFGPDGNLYVSDSLDDQVVMIDGELGGSATLIYNFIFFSAEQLAFDADGTLYMAGTTGDSVFSWEQGDIIASTYFTHPDLNNASGIAFGPDGQLYVSGYDNDVILRYNGVTGEVFSNDGPGGVNSPTHLVFTPDHQVTVVTNNPPAATNLSTTTTYSEGDTNIGITDIVVNDLDAGETITATLTLANTSIGSLSANDGATYTVGTGRWTISGSVANVNFALANLTFNPTGNNDLDTAISVNIDDGDEDASGALTGVITLNVTPVNDPPVLGTIGNQSIDELSALSFTATASDIDLPGDTLTYNLDAGSIALGMSIGSASGDFSWTPSEGQGGLTPSVTITVTDDGTGNLIDSEVITVTVNDTNVAPVLSVIGDQSTDEFATLSFTASATDTDFPNDTLTYSLDAASIALGMSIGSNSGEFSWTPSEGQGGLTPSVTITVTDDGTSNLIDSEVITVTVNDTNVAPVLSVIGDQSTDELATLSFTASATDIDLPNDTLTYSLDAGSIALGMSIGSASGDFSWTPSEGQGGLTPSVTITVTDNGTGDLIDSEVITITVNDINVAPALSAIGDQSTDELATLSFTASATDTDFPSDTLNFSLDVASIALGMSIDPNSGEYSWTPTEGQGGLTPSVTITVLDDGNLVDSEVITITVNDINVAPVLSAIGDQSTDELATLSFTASATDTDSPNDTLSYSLDSASVALGMSINPTSGEFSWTPGEGRGGLTPSVTITVTDDGTGNLIDSEVITITVNDINVAPVLGAIGNQSTDELATLSFTASATDTDFPNNTLSYSLDAGSVALGMSIDPTSGDFSWTPTERQGGLTPSVTITVTDDGAGSLINGETFTITVNEVNVAPVVTNLNSVSTYEEGAESVAISDIVVNDGDTAQVISAELTLANTAIGSLSANDGATYSQSTGIWAISDSVANVNAALANLIFFPTNNNDLSTSISINITERDIDDSSVLTGTIALEVTPVNDAPVLSSIGNQTIDELVMISLTATANDIDQPVDTLIYSLDADSIALGMSIDTSSGEFSWTPTEEHGGLTYSVIVTVSDDGNGNLLDSQVITILVNDIDDVPDLAAANSQSIDEQPLPVVTVVNSDLPVDNSVNTLQAEPPVDEPVIDEPLVDVEAPISIVIVKAPNAGLPNETPPEIEAPSVRDYDYGSSIREATIVKPSGLEILVTKLNEQLSFFNDPLRLVNEESFSARLNDMREEIITDTENTEKVVGSSLSVTAGLSGGYVIWLVRSGVLLSSALSSLPTWRFIDPLPVLSGSRNDNSGESDDSLESMVADKGVEEKSQEEVEDDRTSQRITE